MAAPRIARPSGKAPTGQHPQGAEAELLGEARSLEAQGRFAEALERLESAGKLPKGPLAAHLLHHRARLRARLGHHLAASQDWSVLTRAELQCLADRARIALPEQLLLAGRYREAARAYQGLLRSFPAFPSPGIWLSGEAASRLLAGEREAAAALFRRLLLVAPACPEARAAAESLEALEKQGARVAPYTAEEELGRLRRLGRAGLLQEAMKGLGILEASGRLDRDRARLEKARLLLGSYRYEEAAALLGPLAKAGSPKVREAARALLPKALARSGPKAGPGETDGAARAEGPAPTGPARGPMSPGRDEEPSLPLSPRAGLRILVERGSYAAAEKLHRRLSPGPTLFGGYLALRAGSPQRAARELRALLGDQSASQRSYPRASKTASKTASRGARYWLAMAIRAQGEVEEARSLLEDLALAWPLDWYALLARERLAEPGAGPEPAPSPMATRPLRTDLGGLGQLLEARAHRFPDLGRAAALVSQGLPEEALLELGELARRYLLARPGERRAQTLRPICAEEAWRGERHLGELRRLDPAQGRAVSRLEAMREAPGGARQPSGRPRGRDREPTGAAFPEQALYQAFLQLGDPYLASRFSAPSAGRPTPALATPFSSVLLAEAKAVGLPPGRLWAVMTVESAWCPNVVSSAGAVGLLQIMPMTAQRLARLLGICPFQLFELFWPEVSIRLGAAYLGRLLERFNGQHALAVAAYNGGPHNVSRWLGARAGRLELDGLVEEIPFGETRAYVKKVMGLTARYALELGEPLDGLVRLRLDPTTLNNIDF